MKKYLIFSLLLLLVKVNTFSQITLKSVTPFADYSIALEKKEDITAAKGWGGGLEITFSLSSDLSFSLIGSYSVIDIEQKDAHKKWNWAYWNLRYGGRVSTMLLDTNYSVQITPNQSVNLLPVLLTINYSFSPLDDLKIDLSAGGGIYIFQRTLYILEHWKKKFPTLNNYVYEYEYRDYADDKNGSLFGFTGAIGITYKVYDWIDLFLKGKFNYIPNQNRGGYSSFPINNIINTNLGIAIYY
jgi:hypothetical protein